MSEKKLTRLTKGNLYLCIKEKRSTIGNVMLLKELVAYPATGDNTILCELGVDTTLDSDTLTEYLKDLETPANTMDLCGTHGVDAVTQKGALKLQPHYDNDGGSVYEFCNRKGLNPWETDIIKRIVRCRKKGAFHEDLKKTKDLIDLYLDEEGHKYEQEVGDHV